MPRARQWGRLFHGGLDVGDALFTDTRLYNHLLAIDRALAERARHAGCRRCGGRLDSATYPRKPRETPAHTLGDPHRRRLSFCCARCRQRVTPPSVRFFGRRVYSGAVVVLACLKALTAERVAELKAMLGVDRRTLRRWRRWWREAFVHSAWWRIEKARFSPPLDQRRLPGALLERFAAAHEPPLVAALRFLSPMTTHSA